MARSPNRYRAASGGSRRSARMAAATSQAIEKLFDPAEKSRRFRLSIVGRELFELDEKLALLFGEILWRFHRILNVHVAQLLRAQHRHSFAGQPEAASVLRAGGHLDPRLAAVDRRHLELAAKGCRHHRYGYAAMQIRAVPLEEFVRRNGEKDV